MSNPDLRPPGDDSPEGCPELDDAYFEQIDESFAVIDCWEDGKNDDDDSLPFPPVKVKEEPGEKTSKSESKSSSSSRSRKDSERSNKEPRTSRNSRDRDDKRRSNSPLRNRRTSPFRPSRPLRPTPPVRVQRRSPVRRNSPPRRNNNAPTKNRSTFLEDIMKQIPELRQDIRANNTPQPMNNVQGNFNNSFGMMNPSMNPMLMPGVGMMPQPNFNAYPNGFQPMMDAYGHPMQMNAFVNPGMMSNQAPHLFNPPTPVPAPTELIIVPEPRQPSVDPRIKSAQAAEHQKKTDSKEDLLLAKKKAFENGKISMSDYLRQMCQQKSKTNTEADISSKRSRVHERCKKAAQLLSDLTEDKVSMPFIFRTSSRAVEPLKNSKSQHFKSPLIMSDSNARFTQQSSGATSNAKEALRTAVMSNPLRNIPSILLSFGRNLGLDMVEISQQIQRQVNEERRHEQEQEKAAAAVKKAVIMNSCHKDTQTDLNCQRCENRNAVKFNTRSTQSETLKFATIATQSEEEPGGFRANLNANMLRSLTREQEDAIGRFCQAFDIRDDRFISVNDENEDANGRRDELARYEQIEREVRINHGVTEERLTYANPENPNSNAFFTSFSPLREDLQRPTRETYSRSPRQDSYMRVRHDGYSRSPEAERYSRSPKRPRIKDRLGEKIERPFEQQQRFQFQNFPGDNLDMTPSTSRHFRPTEVMNYRIPTPEYMLSREQEGPRYPSREYQHRSRSPRLILPPVSVSFDNSRSPPHPFADRRGRY